MDGGTAHLDDLVLGILYFLRKQSDSFSFTANRESLHRAFHGLKQGHASVLAVLRFRDKGMFPESLGVDQSLMNLEASGLLHRKNAAPRYYEIEKDIDRAYGLFVSKRLAAAGVTPQELQTMADELQKAIEQVVV